MTFSSCRPLFNVSDVAASVAFWRDMLGFKVTQEFEYEGALAFAQLSHGEAEIMLNGRGGDPAARKARAGYTDAVFYFRVESVHALRRDLVAKGAPVGEIEAQEYGLDEMILRDPDGYELAFTSPIDLARRSV